MAEANPTCRDPRFKDLTGQVFGRLTVLKYAGKRGTNKRWLCRCECGEHAEACGSNLTRGLSRSCGCLRRELVSARRTTHGRRKTAEYRAWAHLIGRCCTTTDHRYSSYGGRGITVCDRWRESFEAFYEDMGDKPSPRHSIERRENSGNYEPGNCIWATPKQQARNTRRNVLLTFDGRTQCIAAWAEELEMNSHTLARRIRKGWSIERALTEPVH
jgi:hypothetical protein